MQKEVVVVLVVVDGLVLAIWPVPQRLLLFPSSKLWRGSGRRSACTLDPQTARNFQRS